MQHIGAAELAAPAQTQPQGSRARPSNAPTPAPSPIDPTQSITAPVHIGIMWESSDPGLDVDLYVRVADHPELSYKRVRSLAGEYVHDWRQPNTKADFEWVRLKPPVQLDQIQAWVNLFKGAGPISGRVAVHFEDKTFTGSFAIKATRGNGGWDADLRQSSPCWSRVDIKKIVAGTE
jgi:hypothetical protein